MPPKKPVNDNLQPKIDEVTARNEFNLEIIRQSNKTANDDNVLHAVNQLIDSQIVTVDIDNKITWRTGHLEHIANLFAGDPATTERDYADDLAVARAYSADVWERLTGKV